MSGAELLSWFPAIITITQIWRLSLEPGSVSEVTSAQVASNYYVRSFFGIKFPRYDDDLFYDSPYHDFIRSLAHVSEYAFLGICIYFACSMCKVKGKLRNFYSILIPCIVACFDECIQLFVPERAFEVKDILLDALGAVIIVALFSMINKIRRKANRKANKKEELKSEKDKLHLFDISIDNISFAQAIDRIKELSGVKNGRHYIVTPNADHLVKLEKDSEFGEIYDSADMVVTDGSPLMWIMDSIGHPIKEKITGADMLPRVCEMAAEEGRSIYIVGAAQGVAGKASDILMEKYKGLNILGSISPNPGFENNAEQTAKVIQAVNNANPDILVFALGSPKQEKFIYEHRQEMNFGVALPFGAAVDFAAGSVKRAPMWMRKAGLEWLYRFMREPGRLFKRYFIDDTRIFVLFWKYRRAMLEANK